MSKKVHIKAEESTLDGWLDPEEDEASVEAVLLDPEEAADEARDAGDKDLHSSAASVRRMVGFFVAVSTLS